ncbi:MAG: hypothetical protein RSA99_01925 [Oscillospiraceae bacterium]
MCQKDSLKLNDLLKDVIVMPFFSKSLSCSQSKISTDTTRTTSIVAICFKPNEIHTHS